MASLAVAGVVGMAEAGAVILAATPTGQFSVSSLYGIGQLTQPLTPVTATLGGWAREQKVDDVWAWLVAHLGFDLLFLIGSGLLAVIMLRAAEAGADSAGRAAEAAGDSASRAPGAAAGAPAALAAAPPWVLGYWLLGGAIAVDLVQDGLAALAAAAWIRRGVPPPGWLGYALHFATVAKWLAAIALLIWAAYRILSTPYLVAGIGRLVQALKQQRFSLVVLVLLALIAISRGSDVLEQMPDVERAWLTPRPGLGWVQLAAAITAQLLLAALLLYLGRTRVYRAVQKFGQAGDHRAPGSVWAWVLVPLGLLAVSGILELLHWTQVSWPGAAGIPLVMLVVAVAWGPSRSRVRDARIQDRDGCMAADAADLVALVRTVGDLLAVAVVAMAGLGLVRAFTAPALILHGGYAWASRGAVAIGIAVAFLAWVVARLALGRAAETLPRAGAEAADPGPGQTPVPGAARWARRVERRENRPWLMLAAAAVLAAADVMLIFVPLWTTHWLGVLGTAVIGLSTLALGLAGLAQLAQNYQPPPVFRLMRLSSTPVISLIVIAGILSMVINRNSPLHDIRLPRAAAAAGAGAVSGQAAGSTAAADGGSAAVPATLAGSLQQWLADPLTKNCAISRQTRPGAPPVRIEPLILVAASGGGIRAAWWAVHAMTMLAGTQCGRHGVFAVSSVSGGSVGLGVLATSAHPDQAIARIAGPDALAATIDGLLLRDMIASYTGLNLTAAQMPAGQRYPDRAALMEHAWEAGGPGLRDPFPLSQPAVPWRLLFNSTAVRTGCRAIIPDRSLAGPGMPATRPNTPLACGLGSAAPAADSYDLLAKLPCLKGLDTATAALLSARFTFITPSGVVSGCLPRQRSTAQEQFVDGGYADSSGLATLAGLAPSLTAAVRQYNAHAVAVARTGQPVTLVVPVTVYLGNSPQVVPSPAAPGSDPELLVPEDASSASGDLTSADAFLQQIGEETAAAAWLPCPPAGPPPGAAPGLSCASLRRAAATAIPRQLVVIAPQTEPQVAAPLGWVLSRASQQALDTALAQDATQECQQASTRAPDVRVYCPAGIGGFHYLLGLITSMAHRG